jgi:hypothetical protein
MERSKWTAWRWLSGLAILVACSTSTGGEVTSERGASAPAAQTPAVLPPAPTLPLDIRLARAGDGYGPRFRRMRELAPEVDAVLAGGSASVDRLIAELAPDPDVSRDAQLVVNAYALGAIGDPRAIGPLADFLSRTRSGDVMLAPQAATHTLLLLLGDPFVNEETYYYTLDDIDYATFVGFIVGSLGIAQAAPRPSCQRRYVVLDAAGNPIVITDPNGFNVPLVVTGSEFTDITRVSAASDWQNEVTSGGGTYVRELDGGVPNRRFNCAGYAFRELNRGGGWNVAAPDIFRSLTQANLLREKSGPPAPGDKVFYLFNGSVAHVAEVQRIDPNGAVIVRNADNQSGVFDAAIDAPYYKTRQYEAKVYELTRPTLREDAAVAGDPGYCNDHPPVLPSATVPDAGAPPTPPGPPTPPAPPPPPPPNMCPPPSGNVVGFCAGESGCPAGGGACACAGQFCCPVGFCYTRDIAGCQQETCPPGIGRHYNDTCACDAPNTAVYDPCRPGFMTDCIRAPGP